MVRTEFAILLPRGCSDGIAPGPRGCDAFGRLLFVMHYRRINVLQLRWRPFSRTCNLATCLPSRLQLRLTFHVVTEPSRLQLRLADEKKSARRQFSPLGTAGGVMNPAQSSRIFNPVGLQTRFRRITNHAGTRTDLSRSLELKPDADCGRGRLFPRFRLTSCSAAYGGNRSPFCTGTSRGCNCASQAKKPARRQFRPLGNGQGMADVNTRVQQFLQKWPWRALRGCFL